MTVIKSSIQKYAEGVGVLFFAATLVSPTCLEGEGEASGIQLNEIYNLSVRYL